MKRLLKNPSERLHISQYGLCLGAALIPLWIGKYLPMIDIPQHAAQISILKNLYDPSYGFINQFELNYFTPYLMPILCGKYLSYFFSVPIVLKILVSFAILGLPLSLLLFCLEIRQSYWWSIFGIPLAYSFSFYWGFLSFIVALPLGVLCLTLTLNVSRNATAQKKGILLLLGFLLFFSHIYVYLICLGLATSILLLDKTWTKTGPFLLAPLFCLYPWVHSTQMDPMLTLNNQWRLGLDRVYRLLFLLTGSVGDLWAAGLSLTLLGLFLMSGRKKAAEWRKQAIPFFLVVVGYFLSPHRFHGQSFLYQRLVFFLFPTSLLFLSERPIPARLASVIKTLTAIIVLVWMGVLSRRFYYFNLEARDFDTLIAPLPRNQRVLGLMIDQTIDCIPGERQKVFNYFTAYYQMEKGGDIGFSFADFLVQVARYKERSNAPLMHHARAVSHIPTLYFDPKTDSDFDYYIVRSVHEDPSNRIQDFPGPFLMENHIGSWYLYKNPKGLSF